MTRQEIETDITEIARRLDMAVSGEGERYVNISEEVKPKVDEYVKTCKTEIARLKESEVGHELKEWRRLLRKCREIPLNKIST
ncbi:MAG: hypothetical protein LUD47_07640 [Clostridia bacterium]|nr:hypothetical protein [Clostridia bacterium]